jgi:Uma2 family endonuclease
MTLADPKTRRWTRDEYYQMADLGFFQDQRVELIEGEIIQMAPQKEVHAIAIGLGQRALESTFGIGYWVRVQLPLFLTDISEPGPDLAVVQGSPRDYLGGDHPRTALLIVEVSEANLRFDRGRKASLYAAAGIKDYWIVNLIELQLEVLRDLVADPTSPFGFTYKTRRVLKSGESISPLAHPHAVIKVSDVLP